MLCAGPVLDVRVDLVLCAASLSMPEMVMTCIWPQQAKAAAASSVELLMLTSTTSNVCVSILPCKYSCWIKWRKIVEMMKLLLYTDECLLIIGSDLYSYYIWLWYTSVGLSPSIIFICYDHYGQLLSVSGSSAGWPPIVCAALGGCMNEHRLLS